MITKRAISKKNSGPEEVDATLNQRIRRFILDKITSGVWPQDALVPSEHRLVKLFKVSRMTVHNVLRDLQREGVLSRRQGVGTFVAPPAFHLTLVPVHGIAQEIKDRGGEYSAEVLVTETRPAGLVDAAALNIPRGRDVYHLVILHKENGSPIQLEDRILNAAAVPGFINLDFQKIPTFAELMKRYPYPEGTHVIRAIEPSPFLCKTLNLRPGEPCLEVERKTWVNDVTITSVRLDHPAHRFELEGEIVRR